MDAFSLDRRCYDLDNLLESTEDSPARAEVREDDGRIDILNVIRREPVSCGRLVVEV